MNLLPFCTAWGRLRSGIVKAFLVASTLRIGTVAAASYDPDLTWRTIQTEHFNIHFHQGEEQLADEFSEIVEEVYETLVPDLRWTPRRRTELVLVDRTDGANGYASVVPYNAIVIFVTAPTEDSTLNLYEDWSTAIFTHELTHIMHMDTNHGLVRAARAVVGRIASTNDLSPLWMVEGFATFQETRHTTGGRGRAAWPDMIKRTAVVEDDFPPLGNLDGIQPDPPSGNLRYLFGQDFIEYVANSHGEGVWTRWIHTYGSGLPYLMPSKKVFGDRITRMYKGWRDHLVQRYSAQAERVRADGETLGRLLSLSDASCIAPAFSPDGKWLVWSCYDLRTGSAIWRSDGEGYAQELLLQDRGASYFTWRADSKAFVYAGTHLVNRFNTWSDIYMHTLGDQRPTALTSGARARDPDFSPDGSKLLVVTNKVQNNQLEMLTVDRRRTAVTVQTDHIQFSTPRWSPDGSVVALSMWEEGRRDLWLFSPQGERLRRLTQDAAIDADPVWSPDGRWLYFSSDRSGIPNVYAIEVHTEHLYQVTNVVTGAVKPAVHPEGHLLAYQQYSHDGWDIRMMELDPEAFLDRGLLPRPVRWNAPIANVTGNSKQGANQAHTTADVAAAWDGAPLRSVPKGPAAYRPTRSLPWGQDPPQETLDSFDDANAGDVFGEEADYPFRLPPRRYNPLPTLLPRFIAPTIQTSPFPPRKPLDFTCIDSTRFCPSLVMTVATGSGDTLRHYGWSAFANYRSDADFLGGGGAFTLNRFLPVFSIGASTRAVSTAPLFVVDPERLLDADGNLQVSVSDQRYWERRTSGFAQVSFPYGLRSTVFAQYSYTLRRELDPFPSNVFLPAVPFRGTVGAIGGGYRFSWAQQTAYAVTLEDARIVSLVANFLHPWLGTFAVQDNGTRQPLSQLQLSGEAREYIVNPLIPNHVLAMRLASGIAIGGTDFLGNYQLGGSIGDSAFYVIPDEFRMLRGYPFGWDVGDMYWLTGIEYRLPLWRIQRGIGTIPAYLRHLSGSVFLDAGNAFDSPRAVTGQAITASELVQTAAQGALAGVGAEVSLSSVVGWSGGLSGRLGYAYPLTGRPSLPPTYSSGSLYLQFGGSF